MKTIINKVFFVFRISFLAIFWMTCRAYSIKSHSQYELRSLNYEIKVGDVYEKSLNIPKVSAFLISNKNEIEEILNDPNNVPMNKVDSKVIKSLLENHAVAFCFNIEDIEKQIAHVLLNEVEPVVGIGFQYDQIKVNTVTGGYPGRGQFSVQKEELFPFYRFDQVKANLKLRGYGQKDYKIIKSNRFVFIFQNEDSILIKNNLAKIVLSDGSKISIYF
ncbi:hypothetical protein [Leptospira santarosai]|uniref:Uncharacterized protein n=1 Tax=Leptospira santarosai str. ZUN179 TaxID=1049985 RepID=M6UMZ1_9LEPT|nr:hypothetical protein [Leptospira santarosai]EMO46487.1 hypothetical protein LEP1GSC187_1276 [Leptospira santarosai str. ZUN179]EMP04341.1 hypothetical protein LEP1GSC171_2040 [Leptospira santarosai str. HAI1380]